MEVVVMGMETVVVAYTMGSIDWIQIGEKTITNNIELIEKYHQWYYKFEHNETVYRFCRFVNPEILLANDSIYICKEKKYIQGHEGNTEWVIKYRFEKIGKIIDFPEISRFKRDFRLDDLVYYGIKINLNGKEYFDDHGVTWEDRYARAFEVISQILSKL